MIHDQSFSQFFIAIDNGDLAQVRAYLEQGMDVEIRGKWGATPLILAVFAGHAEIVLELLKRGANVDARYDAGNTPLIVASWLGHGDLARMLIENGADIRITNRGGDDALAWAAEHGHLEIVELLLSAGANTLDAALVWTSENGHTAIARLLVQRGASLEHRHGKFQLTPLAAAAYRGHVETVHYLLDAGADIHAMDDVALGWACGFRQLAVAEVLVAHGANVNGHGAEGRTFLQEALDEQHDDVASWLTAHGASG